MQIQPLSHLDSNKYRDNNANPFSLSSLIVVRRVDLINRKRLIEHSHSQLVTGRVVMINMSVRMFGK